MVIEENFTGFQAEIIPKPTIVFSWSVIQKVT